MAHKELEAHELTLSRVLFSSHYNAHTFISFITCPTGATCISGASTTIINSMLYDNCRKLFTSQTNTAITTQIEKVLNWLLQQDILVPFPDSLRNYLLQHFDMLKFLPIMCKIAIDQAGSSSQLSLDVYQDPEIQDEYLTLYIRRSHYDESIDQLINEVASECQEYLSESTGWLLVTTDFRPPQ